MGKIADCTEAAVTVGVWIVTPTITLPGVTANSTAVMGTLARAAIAVFISVRTFGVNEETSPPSRRENATTLMAREGGGDGGGGDGGGDGGGGEGGGEGGGGEGPQSVQSVPLMQ